MKNLILAVQKMFLVLLVGSAALSLVGLQGTIQRVAVSPDGRRIAAADSGGVHRVWDAGPRGGSTDPGEAPRKQ